MLGTEQLDFVDNEAVLKHIGQFPLSMMDMTTQNPFPWPDLEEVRR